MPIIQNIKIKVNEYGDVSKKLVEKYNFLDMTDERKAIIKRLTPAPTRTLTFDLIGKNTDLANAFRRTMLDEIEWPRLTCTMDDVKSNDSFVQRMTDYVQNRLWLVPTSWVARTSGNWQFRLDVTNQTTAPIIVKSREITAVKAPPGFEWDGHIDLIELLPGRTVKIAISIEWGINLSHASFSNFSGLTYLPLEYLDNKGDLEKDLPRSATVNPKNYRLGFTCENFIDPSVAARLGWQTIHDHLTRADKSIQEFEKQNSTIPYLSGMLNVTLVEGNVVRYEFFNETYTLGNLIYRYSYNEDPSIEYMLAGDDHPEDKSILIKIRHKEHSKLMRAGIAVALKDVAECIKSFS